MATYNTLDPTSNTESDDTYLLMQNGINRLQTKGILSAALDQGQWQNSFDYRINDITRGTDGKRYIALDSNGPNTANGVVDPVTGAEGVWFDCTDTLKGEGTASFSDNSDKLDGQHGGFYRDASNLNSGTIPSARLPDATLTQKGVVEKATASDVQAGTDNEKYVTPASVNAALINMVGFLMYRTVSTTPSGRWIKANGFEISRTAYADLFAEASASDNFISQSTKDADPETYAGYYGDGDGATTFTLPDLRGEFVRGWDDARGIDAGRAFGSWQADELVNHDHGLNFKIISNRGDTEGRSGKVASGTTKTKSFGGDETRPRNIALIAWIRY